MPSRGVPLNEDVDRDNLAEPLAEKVVFVTGAIWARHSRPINRGLQNGMHNRNSLNKKGRKRFLNTLTTYS
jgi:hypothetical protein